MRICLEGFWPEFIEEQEDLYAIAFTQNVLSGRWKYFILWYLKDGVILREVYPEVPPRVEYSLTDKGRMLLPILEQMKAFGKQYGEKSGSDQG